MSLVAFLVIVGGHVQLELNMQTRHTDGSLGICLEQR